MLDVSLRAPRRSDKELFMRKLSLAVAFAALLLGSSAALAKDTDHKDDKSTDKPDAALLKPQASESTGSVDVEGRRIAVNGLYRHGFLLAPAMARMAADLLTGGPRPEVMDADRAER